VALVRQPRPLVASEGMNISCLKAFTRNEDREQMMIVMQDNLYIVICKCHSSNARLSCIAIVPSARAFGRSDGNLRKRIVVTSINHDMPCGILFPFITTEMLSSFISWTDWHIKPIRSPAGSTHSGRKRILVHDDSCTRRPRHGWTVVAVLAALVA
jgi:hypothetical protein